MLTLLLSIMMSLNIRYTVINENQVQISKSDAAILQSSPEYQKNSTILPAEGLVIVDETDPSSSSDSSK